MPRVPTLQKKVVITDRPLSHVEVERAIISEAGGFLEVHDSQSIDELQAAVRAAYVILVNLAPLDRDIISHLDQTRGIVRYGVGYDNVDVEAATEKGIYVANAPGYCSADVAEHTIGLILSLTRRIPEFDSYVRRGRYKDTMGWKHHRPMPRLAGKKVGIVGFGKIGREVARRLLAFGVSVIVHDPYIKHENLGDLTCGIEFVDMRTLLESSDIITIHAPLTHQTEGMIGKREFTIMKPTALLVNAARGGIVDEIELSAAVRSGAIAGAAMDTLSSEPPPSNHPLLNQSRIIVTPHVAWYSEESVMDLECIVARQAAQILRGEAPSNLVNTELAPSQGSG